MLIPSHLKSYFRSSGYVSTSVIETKLGNKLHLEKLPAFLRTLLVTDGTVTKSLEAWFWEPVSVIAKHNQQESLIKAVTGLALTKGDPVLQRQVSLQGDKTKRIFATASSTVSLNHLPEDIGLALKNGQIGIGELLRDKGLETYRDIFDINYFPDGLDVEALSGEVISRSYRILVNGKAAIIVTEFFPVELYV